MSESVSDKEQNKQEVVISALFRAVSIVVFVVGFFMAPLWSEFVMVGIVLWRIANEIPYE